MTTVTYEQARARLVYEQEWFDYAGRVAKSFSRSFPGIPAEDIGQELCALLIEKKEQFLAQDNPESYIKVSLKHAATAFCKRERSSQMFWTDDYLYRPDDIRDLLAQYFEGPQHPVIPEDAIDVHGDDDLAVMADISMALSALPENYRNVLYAKYLGEELTEAKDRQTLSRAIRRMTEILNIKRKNDMQNHTGPGARKVVTNANAMSHTRMVMAYV